MIVLDANILIRAVLGKRARNLLFRYSDKVRFLVPEAVLEEADINLPLIYSRRGVSYRESRELLEIRSHLNPLIELISEDTYRSFKDEAAARLRLRDPKDWPVLAAALAFNCPIWTEDADFFGTGVATWTTDRIEIYLRSLMGSN